MSIFPHEKKFFPVENNLFAKDMLNENICISIK